MRKLCSLNSGLVSVFGFCFFLVVVVSYSCIKNLTKLNVTTHVALFLLILLEPFMQIIKKNKLLTPVKGINVQRKKFKFYVLSKVCG